MKTWLLAILVGALAIACCPCPAPCPVPCPAPCVAPVPAEAPPAAPVVPLPAPAPRAGFGGAALVPVPPPAPEDAPASEEPPLVAATAGTWSRVDCGGCRVDAYLFTEDSFVKVRFTNRCTVDVDVSFDVDGSPRYACVGAGETSDAVTLGHEGNDPKMQNLRCSKRTTDCP